MKISELKESKYLSQDDVTPPILVTIHNCTKENLAMQGQPEKMKAVLHFVEPVKPMVLNGVNTQLIEKIYPANDTDEWSGKRVVLYNDPNITFQGKLVGGIRVRAPKPKALPSAPAPTAIPTRAPNIEEDPDTNEPY